MWTRGDTVNLQLDGTSATVLQLEPLDQVGKPLLFNDASTQPLAEQVHLVGSTLQLTGVTGEPGTTQSIGALLPHATTINTVQVNGKEVPFHQAGEYVETPIAFAGIRFAQTQQVQTAESADGLLSGSFVVPQRVFDQLAARKKLWPVPWTPEDYVTTWLAPDRLLLFVQFANPKDSLAVTAILDGQALKLIPAYSSVRKDPACFVGFYADLSNIASDVRHTIELRIPGNSNAQFQGIFFDNVLPQFTQRLEPAKATVQSAQ